MKKSYIVPVCKTSKAQLRTKVLDGSGLLNTMNDDAINADKSEYNL